MSIPVFEDQKLEQILVTFVYGNPVVVIYGFTSGFEVKNFGGIDFQPLPKMEIDLAENAEDLTSDATEIILDTLDIGHLPANHQAYLQLLYSDDSMPRTFVVVNKILTSLLDGTESYEFLYKGEISRRERNPSKKKGLVKIESNNPKAAAENISSGFNIGANCENTFGGAHCGFDLNSVKETGTIEEVLDASGFLVRISGLSTEVTIPWDEYWQEGSVEKGGHSLKIVEWVPGEPDAFKLSRRVPAAWIGTTAQVRPGCLHDVPACQRWDNEEHANILGKNLSSSHPILEVTD